MDKKFDILVVGGGIAGMTAALYGARYGFSVAVVEESVVGGQIVNTPDVENYPGIKTIGGAELSFTLLEQVTALGVGVVYGAILEYDIKGEQKTLKLSDKTVYGKTLIIANGLKRRELGCKGEQELKGRGVGYCATCDGAFYRNKVTAIVGGGNTALDDALFLSNICEKVYVIHRRDEFRGNQITVDKMLKKENIEIVYSSTVKEIVGENKVEKLVLNTKNGEREITLDGVFIAVGQVSSNDPFKGLIDMDESGFFTADETTVTNIEGVFVAGDTRAKELRQLITAAADGAVAASQCAKYLG